MSLMHQTETAKIPTTHSSRKPGGFWQGIGRISAGWLRVLRWTVLLASVLILAMLLALYFLDWNSMRGPIARYASARTGRLVRIEGDLKVQLFRLQPHVEVNGLYLGNPAWFAGNRPQGAGIPHGVIEFRLFPAIFGNWILPLVELDNADLLLVRRADGRTNWDSNPNGAAATWHIPPISNFLIRNSHVEVDDEIRNLKFLGTISSSEQIGSGPTSNNLGAFQLSGAGTLNNEKFLAEVNGGPLIHVDESKPYAFTATVTDGQTHAELNGAITHPFHLDKFGADMVFSGANLSDLYYLTGLAMPRTPPYRITARLDRDGALYSLKNLAGTVGASDLHGELTVDASGQRPLLRGTLASRSMDFADLGSVVGGGKAAPPSQAGVLFPDTVLHTERLRQMDADIGYTADSIRSQDFPLRGLATHIHLENGVLSLNPLAFAFAQGKLAGSLKVDARSDVPVTSVDARLSDIRMENFIKNSDKPLTGTAEARAVLTGRGNSVHKVATSASGTLTAAIPTGGIRHSLAEWLGINVLNALSLSLSGDNSNTGLRCAVAHFTAKDGVFTSQQFVIDADPVLVKGSGTVDLTHETMDLTLQGAPKHFQIFRLRAPITIQGPLQHPDLGVKAGPAVEQGAVGAGLAVINPFAAILAFVDPGLADNANCAGLLSDAKSQGAPVKASQVQNAPSAAKK